jgi:uncharacterized protein
MRWDPLHMSEAFMYPWRLLACWLPGLIAVVLLLASGPAVAQDGGYLGVAFEDVKPDEARSLGWAMPRGIKVTKVIEGTPADKAGLRTGDIILAVDRIEVAGSVSRTSGTVTTLWPRLMVVLDLKRPGDSVEIAVFRTGEERKIAVTLGARPPPAPPPPPPACTGKSFLSELERIDPAGHARIMAEARATPNAKGLLWRIEKAGLAPSHLFGTIHLTDERVTTLSPAVKAAFSGAKKLALELADMSSEGMAQAMQDVGTLGQYGGGQSLKTELPPADYLALQDMLKKRGLPAGALDGMRPWMLMLALALPACEQMRQGRGGLKVLDARLADDAKARGIPVVGLETGEGQMRAMAGMSTLTQLVLVVSTVRSGDRIEDMIEAMVQGHVRQDLGFVFPLQYYLHEKASLPRSAVEELETVLLIRRNHGMRDAALPLLAEGGLFIAVGAGHLSGRDGLVELLRQSGFTVTAVE